MLSTTTKKNVEGEREDDNCVWLWTTRSANWRCVIFVFSGFLDWNSQDAPRPTSFPGLTNATSAFTCLFATENVCFSLLFFFFAFSFDFFWVSLSVWSPYQINYSGWKIKQKKKKKLCYVPPYSFIQLVSINKNWRYGCRNKYLGVPMDWIDKTDDTNSHHIFFFFVYIYYFKSFLQWTLSSLQCAM